MKARPWEPAARPSAFAWFEVYEGLRYLGMFLSLADLDEWLDAKVGRTFLIVCRVDGRLQFRRPAYVYKPGEHLWLDDPKRKKGGAS